MLPDGEEERMHWDPELEELRRREAFAERLDDVREARLEPDGKLSVLRADSKAA